MIILGLLFVRADAFFIFSWSSSILFTIEYSSDDLSFLKSHLSDRVLWWSLPTMIEPKFQHFPVLLTVSLFCSQCCSSYSAILYENSPCICRINHGPGPCRLLSPHFARFFSFLPHQFKLRKQHRILISAFSTKWKHFILLALHFPVECDSRQKARENVSLTLHFSLLSRTAVLHWLLFNIWKEYLLYIVFYNCLRWRDSLI